MRFVRDILLNGLKTTRKSIKLSDDKERFIWFDFIGESKNEIKFSDAGNTTSHSVGVTFVIDFHKVLKKIKRDGIFKMFFVREYVRFEPNTRDVVVWSSDDLADDASIRKNMNLPDEIKTAIECVLSTFSDNPAHYKFDIKDCLKKIIVCESEYDKLVDIVESLNLDIQITKSRNVTPEQYEFVKRECVVNFDSIHDSIRGFDPTYADMSMVDICADLLTQIFIINCKGWKIALMYDDEAYKLMKRDDS